MTRIVMKGSCKKASKEPLIGILRRSPRWVELLRGDRVSRLIASTSGRMGISLWREEFPVGASCRKQIHILYRVFQKELGPATEASTIRLAGGDPLEETCLWLGDGDHRETRSLWAGEGDCREATRLLGSTRHCESTPYWGGDGKAVIEALLRRRLYAPWGDSPLRRRRGSPLGDGVSR